MNLYLYIRVDISTIEKTSFWQCLFGIDIQMSLCSLVKDVCSHVFFLRLLSFWIFNESAWTCEVFFPRGTHAEKQKRIVELIVKIKK